MTAAQLMLLDLVVSVVAAGAWIGAALARNVAPLAVALAATLARVITIALLAGSGWWFVQEKVTLTLPLLLAFTVFSVVRRTLTAYLAAGYAALAGPIFTLLHGYPATWPSGLITVAVVGGAATLTARVRGATRLRAPAVASATALMVGVVLCFVAPPSGVDGAGSVSLATLRGPDTPSPGATVRRFDLTARQATVTLASGATVRAWTFNGQVPGPPLTAAVGDLVEVTLHNADIWAGVSLHWHGYDVSAAEDGVPGLTQDAVAPGQFFVYRFRADRAGTYWYHTHEMSNEGVRMGLYGALVVTGLEAPAGVDLTLPVHTFNGSTVVGTSDVEGTRTIAPGTTVRLRLINTDNTPRVMGVAGSPVRVAAVDGTDLNEPDPVEGAGLRITAGGRYDVTFTMPDRLVALRIAHASSGISFLPSGSTSALASVEVAGWPVLDLLHYGHPAATAFGAGSRFDRSFTLVLDRGLAGTSYAYTVNGDAFPDVPTDVVRQGDLVRFTVVNRSQDIHPWHLHGHRVLVLSRDGTAPTGSPLWLDTFDVRPGEVWQVAFRADNPGIWMNHCHNLAHADQGMVLHLAYEGVRSEFHGAHGG